MFYGTIVVPAGAAVLGSHRDQGWITQRVTDYINHAGTVCLTVWAILLLCETAWNNWHGRICWALWILLVICLFGQYYVHELMDAKLDLQIYRILDLSGFRTLHSIYLSISTLQWLAMLSLLILTLQSWQWPQGKTNSENVS